jgi:hypothetical protein
VLCVDAGARQGASSAAGGKGQRVDRVEAGRKREREAGGEAVARSVGVGTRRRRLSGGEGAAGLRPAAEGAGGRDDESRRRIEISGLVPLRVVLPASDQHIELHRAPLQDAELPSSSDEHPRTPRGAERIDVSGAEVRGIATRKLVPR